MTDPASQLGLTPEDDEYLTTEEAAALARCNPKTIRRAIADGHLRAFRPAHKMLLLKPDIHQWVQSRAVSRSTPPGPRPRPRAGRNRNAPGSVAALRAMDSELTR